MVNPCRFCYLSPHDCPTMCTTKMKYVNEVDEDVPIIRKYKKSKSHVFYERGKKYEWTKNGIRREIC